VYIIIIYIYAYNTYQPTCTDVHDLIIILYFVYAIHWRSNNWVMNVNPYTENAYKQDKGESPPPVSSRSAADKNFIYYNIIAVNNIVRHILYIYQ